MKKALRRVILIMGVFAFIFGKAGCTKKEMAKNEVKFSTYTQQERKDYVNKYLLDHYDIYCIISDVKQRQISSVKNEDHYFATASTSDNQIISVWISKIGEIKDTYFLIDNAETLKNHFEKEIEEYIPYFQMRAYTEMRDMPKSQFTTHDISGFLKNEDAFTYIRIIVDKQIGINESLLERIVARLSYCDALLYIYVREDSDKVDFSAINLLNYDFLRNIRKDK